MKPRALVLIGALALLLAACGGEDESSPANADSGSSGDAGTEFEIQMTEDMAYEPSSIDVPTGEVISLTLVNTGSLEHDLTLEDGFESGRIAGGESATVEIGPFEESTVGWCSVPGHRAAGMEIDINVVEG